MIPVVFKNNVSRNEAGCGESGGRSLRKESAAAIQYEWREMALMFLPLQRAGWGEPHGLPLCAYELPRYHWTDIRVHCAFM